MKSLINSNWKRFRNEDILNQKNRCREVYRMTLDQLNYLLVLAEEQNVTRAAQRLYITQPTLTTFITKLEKELGTKLFDRTRNPVRLTDNGELYIKKMREILLAEQQLKEELKYHDSDRRRIRIGIGYAHSTMWAQRLAARLLNIYPQLDIQFHEGQEARMISELRKNEIDVFFGHAEIDPVSFVFGELMEERIVLLVPRKYVPDAPENPDPSCPVEIRPELLEKMRMIIPGNSMGLNLNVQLLWKHYSITPDSLIQTNNTISGVQMAAEGLGYMLGNEELVKFLQPDQRSNVVYCTLPDMKQTRKYYYGYAGNNPEKEIILETIRIIKQISGAYHQARRHTAKNESDNITSSDQPAEETCLPGRSMMFFIRCHISSVRIKSVVRKKRNTAYSAVRKMTQMRMCAVRAANPCTKRTIC